MYGAQLTLLPGKKIELIIEPEWINSDPGLTLTQKPSSTHRAQTRMGLTLRPRLAAADLKRVTSGSLIFRQRVAAIRYGVPHLKSSGP